MLKDTFLGLNDEAQVVPIGETFPMDVCTGDGTYLPLMFYGEEAFLLLVVTSLTHHTY